MQRQAKEATSDACDGDSPIAPLSPVGLQASGGVVGAGCADSVSPATNASSSKIEGADPSASPANSNEDGRVVTCDLCRKGLDDYWFKSVRYPNRAWCESCRYATWSDVDPVHRWYVVTADGVSGGAAVASHGRAGESGNVVESGSSSLLMHADASCSPSTPPFGASSDEQDLLCSKCCKRVGARWHECKVCPDYRECVSCFRDVYCDLLHVGHEFTVVGAGLGPPRVPAGKPRAPSPAFVPGALKNHGKRSRKRNKRHSKQQTLNDDSAETVLPWRALEPMASHA